ncbi:MAG: hypothetical protein WAN37_08560 [Bryobacteraceae bacterium]
MFAVAILASGIAAADTIEVTGLGAGASFWIDENGTPTDVDFGGIIDIQLTETGVSGTFERTTMCVQLFTAIDENTVYNTTVVPPSQAAVTAPTSNAALEQIAWLLDTYDPVSGNTLTDDQAAGLQLAIWKIAEDGVYAGASNPFSSGTVEQSTTRHETTNATILSDAESYLTDAVGHSSNLAFVYENVTTGGVAVQMLEGPQYPTGPGSTPESSTFVLAGVALLALGRMARRKLVSH